jgi:two-component system, NarL family, invasion response regulator UvrY
VPDTERGRAIRVAVVDGHPVVRNSLVSLFASQDGFSLAGQGGTALDALSLARTCNPDVLVMDLNLPGLSGINVIAPIRSHAPEVGVLILSSHPEFAYATLLIKQGAKAYLRKTCDPEEIVEAARVVASGRHYIQGRIADLIATELGLLPGTRTAHPCLTLRELQVLLSMANGDRLSQAARELFLSPKTVSTYRRKIFEKLGIDSAAAATAYAVKHGLKD